MRAQATKTCAKSWQTPRRLREGLGGARRGVGRVRIEGEDLVERRHQRMQRASGVDSRPATSRAKSRKRGVGPRQGGLPQEQPEGNALHGAAHDAGLVEGFNLAFDERRQRLQRTFHEEAMLDVSEGVLARNEAAIVIDVDAPLANVLAVVIARRDQQALQRRFGREP